MKKLALLFRSLAIFSLSLLFFVALSCPLKAQKSVKVPLDIIDENGLYLNDGQSVDMHYRELIPKGKIHGVMVLIPGGYQQTEEVLAQLDLPHIATQQGILTIIPSINWGTEDRDAEIKALNHIFEKVCRKHQVDKDRFFMGGFSNGGMIAMTYAQEAVKNPQRTYLKPCGIFGVDMPLDKAHFYEYAVREIKRSFSPVGLAEAKWLKKRYDDAYGGSPSEFPEKYVEASIFSYDQEDGGNAKYLKDIPVRIYTDLDVEWLMEERQRDAYDWNGTNMIAMINRLRVMGNKDATVKISQGKGFRPDGRRHPHSWSVLDPNDCVDWMADYLNTPKTDPANHWTTEAYRHKKIDKLSFTMPIGSFADRNRQRYVQEAQAAIQANNQLLGEASFTDPIRLHFFDSKEAMSEKLFFVASGWADPQHQRVNLVANEDSEPPLQHELMHLQVVTKWAWPANSSFWMNEGLATYAPNACNGYTVDQIYRYMLEHDHLISIDALSEHFYEQPEMIAYHQSAYIVQYLLEEYDLAQFKRLWKEGFEAFEAIYGQSFAQVEQALQKAIRAKMPQAPAIDWAVFMEGCK